jgi:hypothetical protein
VPWLARYAQTLGVDAWLVLAGTATIGWYYQPLIWVGLSPVIFAYYLVYAPRHGPAWHLGLAGITFVGVAPNAWWMWDWGKYWWLRQPIAGDHIPLPNWRAVLGSPVDYPPLFEYLPGGMVLVFGGIIGLVMARVTGVWSAIPPAVPNRVMVLAAGFLLPPTLYAVWLLLRMIRASTTAAIAVIAGLSIVGWVDGSGQPLARSVGVATDPLLIGFTNDQQHLIALLNEQTTPEARVLWDETSNQRPGWNWSALLPFYTRCAFLGGLDPESGVEHSYCAMCSRQLTGRALCEWSDADLMAFCQWYNVGWVVARSPGAIERWARLPQARSIAQMTEDGQPVVLYALERPRSFILRGTATWESANTRCIILTNVVPDEGVVDLSLHMLDGLRVSPSYIKVESLPDPTGRDPVHNVRLRIHSPVPWVTLMWENP